MEINKVLGTIANSNAVKNHIARSSNDAKYLSRTLLLTSVSKDFFAYCLRVHNTLTNDKIPEEKKRFSAAMDATTGILTTVFQIGTGFIVSSDKFQDFFSDKLFKSLKDSPEELKIAKSSFRTLSTLVLATVCAKRILTPLAACFIVDEARKKKGEKIKPPRTA